MKTAAVICEYNPLHSGHIRHLDCIRRDTGCDFIVALMSGDFVQRGEPAVFDKYHRTESALKAGADIVLMLPVHISTASAESFAAGGVSMADHIGADILSFGSECGDIHALSRISDFFSNETDEYKEVLKSGLKNGLSFPAAREKAACAAFKEDCGKLLSAPNNILGIEYLKAILERKSRLRPHTIKRIGQAYSDTGAQKDECFPSSASLRAELARALKEKRQIPDIYPDSPMFFSDLTACIFQKLLMQKDPSELLQYADMDENLAHAIFAMRYMAMPADKFAMQVKSRNFTYTRICRALLHMAADIKKEDMDMAMELDACPYIRLLGFKESARPLLSKIAKTCDIPVITKPAAAEKFLSGSRLSLWRKDINASQLYLSLLAQKKGMHMPAEYMHSPVIIR